MEAAGDGVAAAAELPAGVQHREHDLDGGAAVLRAGDGLHGDAAAVVRDAHGAVRVDGDEDLVGVAGHRFVDGVVDDLVHEVMQPARAGGADVHARPLADRLESFEYLDVAGVVVVAAALLGCQRASDRGRAAARPAWSQCFGAAREGRTNDLISYRMG